MVLQWSFLSNMMRVVRAAEIQEMDRRTIGEIGIPGIVLMENAGRGASRIFLEYFRPASKARTVILCGRGNNGGDGYIIARILHQSGFPVTVVLLSPADKISGDARLNLDIIRKLGVKIIEVPDASEWMACQQVIQTADYIIDGLLGTGLNSRVRGFYGQVIEEINRLGRPVMAIDIPSGINADNGQIMGAAMKADLTVTFGFPKIGQLIYPGVDHVGKLATIDIGIPDVVADQVPSQSYMAEPEDFISLCRNEKDDIHKGSRGHLLILAGSTGKTGAASLTALGGLRAGAGLVTLGIPESLNPVLENKLTEAMTVPLPETKTGSLSVKAGARIREMMTGKTALVLGPGLTTHHETVTLVKQILKDCTLQVVVDADGINALAQDRESLKSLGQNIILTPHAGEMGRLMDKSSAEIQLDRIGTLMEFSAQHNCNLVLKGARTLIGTATGEIYINPTGNSALSSGGSGDVLTGLIGGFLARGWPRTKAMVAGVYLHGLSADLLAEDLGHFGILASELLDKLPQITADLVRGDWPLRKSALHEDIHSIL